ncbi:MAG: NAD(P)H-binding protein [Bacteroidales bacterium]|jgi:NADH dehydrogenase|nr:NAD(P)H-binding protein [Bacteroidales bacterium]
MTPPDEIHAVTGAFGFSGKYITRLLLDKNKKVITLTNSPQRKNEFNNRIAVFPYNFDQPDKLAENLRGVSVLYNTYWVRFNHTIFQHSEAVRNTLILFEAAKKAGVKRIVHTSITNPDENSSLEYFTGKGILETALVNSGLSYAILRPAVLFGDEDILINNIAWMIRKFPVFGTFGDGSYKLQPIFVKDYAELAVKYGADDSDLITDAIGPETFTYRELIKIISKIILGKERPVFSMPDSMGYLVSRLVGWLMGDQLVTKEEIKGLKANLLYTHSSPLGTKKLTEWITEHRDIVGKRYASELKRRLDRTATY